LFLRHIRQLCTFAALATAFFMIPTTAKAQLVGSDYTSATRAMWFWNSAAAIANTGTARTDVLSFCAAPFGKAERRVTHLYLYAHQQVTQSPAALGQFIAAAHAQGMQVYFLDGEATWAETTALRQYAEGVVDTLLSYNTASLPDERFDGIQYDVEPYLLSNWSTQKATYWNNYTTLLANCQTKVDTYNSATGAEVRFEACIPRWYDSDGDAVTSSEQVQDITDSIAIMDYVNTASRIIADATTEVSYADFLGKKAVVGVETLQIEPVTSTFYGQTNEAMEAQLAEVAAAFGAVSGFGGLAIHHYDSYRAMAPGGPAPPQADVAVSQTASTPAPVINKPFVLSAEARNDGPATAEQVQLTYTLPTSLSINSFAATAGTATRAGQVITVAVSSMSAGAKATLNVSVTPKSQGSLSMVAKVQSTTADPDTTDNSAALSLTVKKK